MPPIRWLFCTGTCTVSACGHAAVYLDYAVVPDGPVEPATTVTFINPAGDDIRVSGLPLHGRTPWPGIVLANNGHVVDWHGWRIDGGVWVEGDEFDWAVSAVVVEFEAGAVVDAVVDYPVATSACDPTPYGAVDSTGGSPTGSNAPVVKPPETSTVELVPASPDGHSGLPLLLFAGTLAAAGLGATGRGTARLPGLSVQIETPDEFMSRVARTRRTRPARRSSAPARSRAPRA